MKTFMLVVVVLICWNFAEGNSRFLRQVGNVGNLGGFDSSFGTGTDLRPDFSAGNGGPGTGHGGNQNVCTNGGGCTVGPNHLLGTKSWEICCQGKPAGFYPIYSTGCHSFYRCVDGDNRIYCFDCGPGTKFNPQSDTCDWPHNVNFC